MATVLLDMVISLDGLICGPGGADGGLHDWYFNPSEVSGPIVDELVSTTGAIVVGRGAFAAGDAAGGWDDTPVPHFVVTHRPQQQAPPRGRPSSSSSRTVCGPPSSVPSRRRATAMQPSEEAPTLSAMSGRAPGGRGAAARRTRSARRRGAPVRPLQYRMAPDEDPARRRSERHTSALPRRRSPGMRRTA